MSSGEDDLFHATSLSAQRIFPLSAEPISQIHSSKHVTSLTDVVLSLLENSLDAGANRIDISVDWRRGGCTVDDNGVGINPSEFEPNGGLGKLYCTSKHRGTTQPVHATHGSTGTFLAELAALSLLSITSTHEADDSASHITLHHGRVIARDTKAGQTSGFSILHQRHGTSIAVRDLFGSMPVRVKQRALAVDANSDDSKDWLELKRGITSLILPWPHFCTVKLSDASANARIVTLSSGNASGLALTEKSLKSLAGKAIKHDIRDVLPVLFQAGFALPETRSSWVPLSATTSAIRLKGMICLEPAPTKQCQFIAIGITPCGRAGEHNELYNAVNKVFSNSSFGSIEMSVGDDNSRGRSKKETLTTEQLKPQKGIDRHPMYFIKLELLSGTSKSNATPDLLSEGALHSLVEVLEAAVTAWLDSHLLRPRKRRRQKREEHHTPARPPNQFSESNTTSRGSSLDSASSCDSRLRFRRAEVDAKGRDQRQLASVLANARQSPVSEPVTPKHGYQELSKVSGVRMGRPKLQGKAHQAGVVAAQMAGERPSVSGQADRSRSSRRIQPPSIEAEQYSKTGDIKRPSAPHVKERTGMDGSEHSEDFGEVDEDDLVAAANAVAGGDQCCGTSGDEATVTWIDPATKQLFRVNSRTGVVLPSTARPASHTADPGYGPSPRHRAAIDTALSSAGKPISLARRSALSKESPSSAPMPGAAWLPGFLKEWNNPVFTPRSEEPIPVASVDRAGLLEAAEIGSFCSHTKKDKNPFCTTSDRSDAGTRISRSALQRARVIAQVDRKFILVKLPDMSDSPAEEGASLVLIDQHAASERIILESLFDQLCDVQISAIDTTGSLSSISTIELADTARSKPLLFEITAHEKNLFVQHQSHFAGWGIQYHLKTSSDFDPSHQREKPHHTLVVTALPFPIAERCSNTPSLTIDLLRSEIWAIADGTKKAIPPSLRNQTDEASSPVWMNLLPNMPFHMLQLLNSRACRSAIMFNDRLSVQECQELVVKLGKCVFPFVCAHGRVGMVPVMKLGKEGEDQGFDVGKKMYGGDRSRGDHDYRRAEKGVDIAALGRFMESR
ncbi:DNA mismatch repair protein MLH3 [Pseudocercospora fuligena]|uniref:DNA mismatch repair protein MLH3 n=1 Tax=Pseudocercospora fuligena TaxID=685502 RepID=A0A8H6RKN1_9PEZI|nr:DNA mismatch repair protein MLH3 [Pseudocercospora fuligena]